MSRSSSQSILITPAPALPPPPPPGTPLGAPPIEGIGPTRANVVVVVVTRLKSRYVLR
jgi:hypothetical protein